MNVLCLDIGCTDIKYGVVNDGKIIFKKKVPNNIKLGLENFEENLHMIADILTSVYDISYVGVSCAGSIDVTTGQIIVSPDHAKFLKDFNFKEFFKKGYNLECFADNDVNCFGLAEKMAGKGKEYDIFLMMTVGTGIGGAIVMKHDLWRGPNYNAGEFGRMIMQNGVKYEDVASTSSLIRSAQAIGYDVASGTDVFELYDAKNKDIEIVVKNFYDYLAIGVANIVYAFNPQSVIIGGGITNRNEFIDELKAEVKKILHESFYSTVKIECSAFKNDGGMLGAYYLVKELISEGK